MSTKAVMVGLLVVAGAVGVRCQEQESRKRPGDEDPNATRSRTVFETRALSLDELIDKSERVFLGTVEHVDLVPMTLTGSDTSTEVRVVVFNIEHVYKGHLEPHSHAEFHLDRRLEFPIAEKDELLWYLPRESRLGLVAPLGIESGYFKVTTVDGIKMVSNLKNNQGLWDDRPEASLFTTGRFDQKRLLSAATELGYAKTPVGVVADFANRPNRPAPIPLSLVIAATVSRVEK